MNLVLNELCNLKQYTYLTTKVLFLFYGCDPKQSYKIVSVQ